MTYPTTTYHSQKSTLSDLVGNPIVASLCLGGVVFIACLFGIFSRPLGFLASIWPANAFMLAMLLRLPASASPLGWFVGLICFLAADLLTGANLRSAVLLNSTNLFGIATAFLLYRRFPKHVVRLTDHTSVFYLICATAAGSCVSGIVGAFINPMGSERLMLGRGTMWAVTEFATYVAFLPVLLAAPPLTTIRKSAWKETFGSIASFMPLIALIASCCATIFIGGPGGIAFPVPALLWCSLAYPLFLTTILTLVVGLMTLKGPDVSLIASPINFQDPLSMISFRLGASRRPNRHP